MITKRMCYINKNTRNFLLVIKLDNKWVGKIKVYNCLGHYMGTYCALIEEQDNVLYKMTTCFNCIDISLQKKRNLDLKNNIFYSSSVPVLKRKFSNNVSFKKTKAVWIKK